MHLAKWSCCFGERIRQGTETTPVIQIEFNTKNGELGGKLVTGSLAAEEPSRVLWGLPLQVVAPTSRAKGTEGKSGIVTTRSSKESPCGGGTHAASAGAAVSQLGERVWGRGGRWLAGTSPAGAARGAARLCRSHWRKCRGRGEAGGEEVWLGRCPQEPLADGEGDGKGQVPASAPTHTTSLHGAGSMAGGPPAPASGS